MGVIVLFARQRFLMRQNPRGDEWDSLCKRSFAQSNSRTHSYGIYMVRKGIA